MSVKKVKLIKITKDENDSEVRVYREYDEENPYFSEELRFVNKENENADEVEMQPFEINIDELKDKIIIHRTFRHRNQFINYKFLKNYKDLIFIGMEDEFQDLKKEVTNLEFYNCKNFLEMAKIIKSSKFFIGNQSIAYPMAEALKVPRLLEAEPSFPVVQPIGKDSYDFYYQPHFEKFVKILSKK